MTHDLSALAQEAQAWESGAHKPQEWEDAPSSAPLTGASKAISIRVSPTMLSILKEFAHREGIGYQVLMKKWLDERIQAEREHLLGRGKTKAHQAKGVSDPSMPSARPAFAKRNAAKLDSAAGA